MGKIKGIIVKSTGSWCTVKASTGEKKSCRLKGKLRNKGSKSTHPVAVGDHVVFSLEQDGTGVIEEILPRKNYIVRKSVNLSRKEHILAANLDQAILIITLREPVTYPGFIDRFLVTAGAYHIPAVLIFNKTDLYSKQEHLEMKKMIRAYSAIGYACYSTSATGAFDEDAFKELLRGKVSLISGHSGVGKSTFINALDKEIQLKTAAISSYHKSGMHTTTFAEMYELNFGASIIDTPGIKGLGIVDIPKAVIAHYFPEIRELMEHCKFHNCLHLNEPGCAVKAAVKEGKIESWRYRNYQAIYNDDEEESYRTVDYAD